MSVDALRRFATLPALRDVPTPAVVGDIDSIDRNLDRTLSLIGSPDGWRPHIKTARTGWAVRRLLDRGVRRFKASTVQEVAAALTAGAADVLLAFPAVGPLRAQLADMAATFPHARISILVDEMAAAEGWEPGTVDAFIDLDVGEHRTGVPAADAGRVLELATDLRGRGLRLAGLHYYDGFLADAPEAEKDRAIASILEVVDGLVSRLRERGFDIDEVVAGSSHTFLPTLRARERAPGTARVVVGPGTVVYCDGRSLERFDDDGYEPAVGVLSRVVSRRADSVTVDAGLSAIQLDAGFPHLDSLSHPGLVPHRPAQEHLVLTGPEAAAMRVGDPVILLPRHLDTTLVQFDCLYLVDSSGGVQAEKIVGRRSALPSGR